MNCIGCVYSVNVCELVKIKLSFLHVIYSFSLFVSFLCHFVATKEFHYHKTRLYYERSAKNNRKVKSRRGTVAP